MPIGTVLPLCGQPRRRAPPAMAPGEPAPAADTQPVRIYIVEDDALSAIVLNDLLEMWGYEVCGMAHAAPAAVVEIDRERPDLVLMDIRLADNTDGIAAAREIRSRFGVRSVFVTAHTDRATVARVRATEPLGLLPKPYLPEQLRVTLRDAVERLRPC